MTPIPSVFSQETEILAMPNAVKFVLDIIFGWRVILFLLLI